MRHQATIHWLLCLVLILGLIGLAVPTGQLAAQSGQNLLQNGGFEGEYVAVGGDPSLRLAPNWQPWSLPPPAGASSSVNLRPDYQPAPSNRVRSGSAAQEYNTFFATHDGGIYQRVAVADGTQVTFSVYVYVWSSATFEDINVSTQPQEVSVQVGIDPTGGQDGGANTLVWSEPVTFYDEYRQLSITSTARGNAVTVFVRTTPKGAIGVNNIYVDDASLIATGQSAPAPTAESATATHTPTPNVMPTVTTVAVVTGTRTPTPVTTVTPNATQSAVLAPFPERRLHTVAAGDTVLRLAQRYASTVEAIVAANGLNNAGFIVIGQVLVIPVAAGQGTPATPASTTGSTARPSATPAPGATQAPGSGSGRHVVQAGETLFSIARRYNTTVEALATLNNITNPNLIRAGTVLTVPRGGTTPPNTGTGGTGSQHVVQAGENLFRIALRYGVTVEALAQANRIRNYNLLFAGQVLLIPR
jgi:LysM repeat protein